MTITRTRAALLVLVVAIGAYSMGGVEWARRAMRDEERHKIVVSFEVKWAVNLHDRGSRLRSDSAAIVWHAGDEHVHNAVHHGGKYTGSSTLDPGVHLVSLNATVDADSRTVCKMWIGRSAMLPNESNFGRCHISTVIKVL